MADDAAQRAERGGVMSGDGRRLYELYELAAQSPAQQVEFVRALAGPEARRLGEDFAGTGALSLAWARRSPDFSAVAVDHDPDPLSILRDRAASAGFGDRIEIHEHDVLEVSSPADVIVTFNFSIGYFHERPELVKYLSHVRRRLGRSGVFVCDLYGGVDQFALGETNVELGGGVGYTWEQREADPLTGLVRNAMHFSCGDGESHRDAFTYEWRLWSPAELRDAMIESGFSGVEFYDRLGSGRLDDGSVLLLPASGDELDENFVIYLAARA